MATNSTTSDINAQRIITSTFYTPHVLHYFFKMPTTTNSQNGQDGQQSIEDHTPDHGLANLSLSSRSIHADDYLNKGQDVAPPLHVSTTYRYDRDPEKLQIWNERDVNP
jgi:hypothetical protein